MAEAPHATRDPALEEWDLVITAQPRWFELELGELWRYRDLVSMFVRRDLSATYRQTLLGPAWYVIKPLIATALMVVVFSTVAGLSTDGVPPLLFYLSGLTLWDYFSTCINQNSNVFIANKTLLYKVYFPRLALPVSYTISNSLKLAIHYGLLWAVMMVLAALGRYPLQPSSFALLTPVLVLILAFMSLGVGLVVSSLTARIHDAYHVLLFAVQMAFYASPIIYPASMVPPRFQGLAMLNPVAPIIEAFRFGHFGSGLFSWSGLAYSAGVTLVILAVGLVAFQRTEKTFVDTI